MDKNTVINGIKKIKDNSIIEIILHPSSDISKRKNYIEFQTLKDESLKKYLLENFDLINWGEL